ncbi:DUF1934 domain-containing protein [Nicoliella lavandulae]|uniref:DUF1934 domain-containing protein n=1 Tax=Nicoliella lavandulae TaxID=3082954 RepID=A0ABU8SJV3_9LACO
MSLATQVIQDGDHSDFKYEVDGQLAQIGTALYLRYRETNAETGKEVPVTFKIDEDGGVRLTRAAENRLQLPFALNQRLRARYHTPYGAMNMDVHTHRLDYQYQDDPVAGNLQIDYQLFSGTTLLGEYKIRLQFSA